MSSESPTNGEVEGTAVSGPPAQSDRWSPRDRQVAARFCLLTCAYLAAGAVAGLMFWRRAGTAVSPQSTTFDGKTVVGSPVRIVTSVYQTNPGAVQVLLALMTCAVLVATASVVCRVVHRSPRLGVGGIVAASVVSIVSVLGMLSVGPFFMPLAALLVLLAMPMETLST